MKTFFLMLVSMNIGFAAGLCWTALVSREPTQLDDKDEHEEAGV